MEIDQNSTVDLHNFSIKYYIHIVLFTISILLNILVFILCISKVRQNSYLWFIGDLSLANILVSLTCFICLQPNVANSQFGCYGIPAIGIAAYYAATISRPMLALHRYTAVNKPQLHQLIYKNIRWLIIILALNWIIPILLGILDNMKGCTVKVKSIDGYDVCLSEEQPKSTFCYLPKVTTFMLGYTTLGFCYFKITLALREQQRQLASTGAQSTAFNEDRQLLILMLLHALVPFPIYIPGIVLVSVFREKMQFTVASGLYIILLTVETLVDALLTLTIIKQFRDIVIRFLTGKVCKESGQSNVIVIRPAG